jgi:hypothetical protein
MKYYLYISDAKIDMLLPQIPHDEKQKLAMQFKIDLKLLSVSRTRETETEDNRLTRLEAVLSFIREFGNIGTVDEPDSYIEDTMDMRWGPYMNDDVNAAEEPSPLVYFGGTTDQTIVGLGGSTRHVLGNAGLSTAHSHSATPYLIGRLTKDLNFSLSGKDAGETNVTPGTPENWALRAVELATTQMQGPTQQLEFVAKRLLHGTGISRKKKVLLASPLYVALVDS